MANGFQQIEYEASGFIANQKRNSILNSFGMQTKIVFAIAIFFASGDGKWIALGWQKDFRLSFDWISSGWSIASSQSNQSRGQSECETNHTIAKQAAEHFCCCHAFSSIFLLIPVQIWWKPHLTRLRTERWIIFSIRLWWTPFAATKSHKPYKSTIFRFDALLHCNLVTAEKNPSHINSAFCSETMWLFQFSFVRTCDRDCCCFCILARRREFLREIDTQNHSAEYSKQFFAFKSAASQLHRVRNDWVRSSEREIGAYYSKQNERFSNAWNPTQRLHYSEASGKVHRVLHEKKQDFCVVSVCVVFVCASPMCLAAFFSWACVSLGRTFRWFGIVHFFEFTFNFDMISWAALFLHTQKVNFAFAVNLLSYPFSAICIAHLAHYSSSDSAFQFFHATCV